MKHLISGEEVNIEWERHEKIESHDSGCSYWALFGEDDLGNKYIATGVYQSDELVDVEEIEKI